MGSGYTVVPRFLNLGTGYVGWFLLQAYGIGTFGGRDVVGKTQE